MSNKQTPTQATKAGDIDLNEYDPVERFRSKLRKIQQQTRENTKPTILTKIIDAIDPFDPKCDHLIDEAQIAMRRVAHVHDIHCQRDPSIHETDARETGYTLPSYELHLMPAGERKSWFTVMSKIFLRSESEGSGYSKHIRYGFESNEALRSWLDAGEAALGDPGDDLELPGIIDTPEKAHLELYTTLGNKECFNNTLYADWCRRSESFRRKKFIEWINSNYTGSNGCFFFRPELKSLTWCFILGSISGLLMLDANLDSSPLFLILNTNQVHNNSGRLNKIFNTLKGVRRLALTISSDDGLFHPSSNREATVPGLEVYGYIKRSTMWPNTDLVSTRYPPPRDAHPCRVKIVHSVETFLRPGFVSPRSFPESPTSRERLNEQQLDLDTNLDGNTVFYKLALDSEIYEDLRRAKSRTSERRTLLLLFMGELCRTVHHWALVRTAADEILDVIASDSDPERKSKRAAALFREYADNEFVDYWNTVEKFRMFTYLSAFIRVCRVPSIEQRIVRYLYEVEA